MNRNVKRVMAYICVPLLLSFVGLFIVYICLSPYIKTANSTMSILTNDSSKEVVDDTQSAAIALDDYKESETVKEQPESIKYSPDMYPYKGQLYASIHCDRADIHENVYFGDDSDQFDIGLGQYMGSSIFGYGGPILIGGHHETAFLHLQYVEVGDVFSVHTDYADYTYTVYDIKVADSTDKSATLLDSNQEVLVLYTCYPFTPLTSYTQRLFVYATRTSGPSLSRS